MKTYKKISKILTDILPFFIHKNFAPKVETLVASLFIKDKEKTENFGININQGEECVILGNGPSLKDSLSDEKTFEFIKSRKKFCVNESVRSEYFQILKPDYLIFMDPFFWSKDLHEPFKSNYLQISAILGEVDWDIIIFMPKMATEWNYFIHIPQTNPHVDVVYIETTTSTLHEEKTRFLEFKNNLAMPRVQNVLVCCIYLAINIGFENTYIFGADHSWYTELGVNDKNQLVVRDKHFYDNSEVKERPVYKNADSHETWKFGDFLELHSHKYKSYEELEKYSKSLGLKIFNSSLVSFIDSFERKKIQ